jgi:hypothetical protein
MFKDKLEDIFNSKRQTSIQFVPTFKIVPIFNENEDYLCFLENFGIKTKLIKEFFAFYTNTLFKMGIVSDPEPNFNNLDYLEPCYKKYVPKLIDFESYIDVSKNRYLMIYHIQTCPIMRHCAVNFQIVFEYKKFNQDPTILVFPRWENPERDYHQLCEQIFENLYDVFNHVNKPEEVNIIDTWTAMTMEKEFFDQITVLHQINTI